MCEPTALPRPIAQAHTRTRTCVHQTAASDFFCSIHVHSCYARNVTRMNIASTLIGTHYDIRLACRARLDEWLFILLICMNVTI